MEGSRIKLIRQANLLSLQELSDLLVDSDLPVKRASLSHYELGISQPTEKLLRILAKKLGTTLDFFRMPDWNDICIELFSDVELSPKVSTALYSFIQIELEKLLDIDVLLKEFEAFECPKRIRIMRGQEETVEKIADQVRNAYGLGWMPISSVCSMLESNGWRLIELPEAMNVSCMSGYEHSKQVRLILFTSHYAIDDFREAMLEALGRAYLEGETAEETAELAARFARAILLPSVCAKKEFGEDRSEVSIVELTLMKQKYGLGKRLIMLRLKELGIISPGYFDSFEDLMRLHGFPKRKKIMSETVMFYENPTLPAMRILEAVSRNKITKEKADELLLLKHLL